MFLLREENISLTWEQRVTLARINSLFGGVKFTSDDVSGYGGEQKKVLQAVLNAKNPKDVRVRLMGHGYQITADGEELSL